MARARIDPSIGPIIARQGHNVDTAAAADILFDPRAVTARVRWTGTVNVAQYTESNPDWVGPDGSIFARAQLNIGSWGYSQPPLVLAAGIRSDGGADMSPFTLAQFGGGLARLIPHYFVDVTTSMVTLYVRRWPAYTEGTQPSLGPSTWRVWIFDNPLNS